MTNSKQQWLEAGKVEEQSPLFSPGAFGKGCPRSGLWNLGIINIECEAREA